MNAKNLVVILTVLVSLAGCDTPKTSQTKKVSITTENLSTIAGKRWQLTNMTIAGETYPLETKKPTISFTAHGKIAGSASVNKYFGLVKIDEIGNTKWPSPFGSTRMAGPENLMKQESAFLSAIPKTELISLTDDKLTLSSKDGKIELVFAEE